MEDPWTHINDIDGKQHYRTLGLQPGAHDMEIRRAYRRLARRLHPDKGGDSASFARLREAFEVLTDPQRRKVYDRWASDLNFRYVHGLNSSCRCGQLCFFALGVTARASGGEDILLRSYEKCGLHCDPRTQLVVTCEVCRRPATKECWTCKMQICDFCTLKQHWKDTHPLHWPLINSQEFRTRLAKSEMQQKIKEDGELYFQQDPNYRSQHELEVIRSFKQLAEDFYRKQDHLLTYDYRLARFYVWMEIEDVIFLAVHVPTGYKDRQVKVSCDGRRLCLQAEGSRPVLDRLLTFTLPSSSLEITSSTDNRFHVLKLPRASYELPCNRLFKGDSDGSRRLVPLYDLYDVDEEVLLVLRVPFYIDPDDIRVSFAEKTVEIQVRNQFFIRRSFWTELDSVRSDSSSEIPRAVDVARCSWTLEEETVVEGERGRTLSISLMRADPTPTELEWKRGIRQDNKTKTLPGRELRGIRFFQDDEDEFDLESLLQASVFKYCGRCYVPSKPWLQDSSSYWVTTEEALPDKTRRLAESFFRMTR